MTLGSRRKRNLRISEKHRSSVCGKNYEDAAGTNELADVTIPADPDAHDWSDWFTALEPTVDEPGKRVQICKHFDGHRNEESIEKLALEILTGADQTYTIMTGSGQDVVITTNGTASYLTALLMDGIEIDKANYTIASGSTIATLKASYLDTLETGTHIITFVYSDGRTVETSLKIVAASTATPTPEPGQSLAPSTPALPSTGQPWWLVSLLAGIGVLLMVIAWFVRRRAVDKAEQICERR